MGCASSCGGWEPLGKVHQRYPASNQANQNENRVMSGQVIVEVVGGSLRGKRFVFDEHDTFVFGRASDCHIQIPLKDVTASRHHFILEANPPDAALRDLGSLNGTWVNGVKHGGREKGATPEQGAQGKFPDVALRHGDKIKVGTTVLAVTLESPAICCASAIERSPMTSANIAPGSGARSFVCHARRS